MFATASVLVAAILTCAAVPGLPPPGPLFEDPELKSVIVTAQGSLRKTFSELESAADSAMTLAREVLESTTLQANHTVLESQASLQDLLESITTTIATAVYKARKLGANITSCISGQEEAARSVVKQTGSTIIGCVAEEIKKAVDFATNMFGIATSAKNMLDYVPREFHGCLPSFTPTVEEIVMIPSCIGAEVSAFSSEALKIAKTLASYLAEGRSIIETLGKDLKECSEAQIEVGTRKVRQIEHNIVVCVQQQLSAATSS